jgi:hypothetical protein
MNYYHIWADPTEGSDPKEFATNMKIFLDQLVSMNKMIDYKQDETWISQYGSSGVSYYDVL